MKEHNFDLNTHIGGWYIPEKQCDELIDFFHTHPELLTKGHITRLGKKFVDKDVKDSLEFSIHWGHHDGIIGKYRKNLHECMLNYIEKYKEVFTLPKFDVREYYNFQYYEKNGGFKPWHFETGSVSNIDRCFVFMTYLNDVEDGGTEFKYQKLITPAKKGLTIIWPAYWTHTHRGQISNTKNKYIITGWYRYMENNNE